MALYKLEYYYYYYPRKSSRGDGEGKFKKNIMINKVESSRRVAKYETFNNKIINVNNRSKQKPEERIIGGHELLTGENK